MKVLVVDDDPCTLSLLAECIESSSPPGTERFEVLPAKDGASALAVAQQQRDISFILMDYHMPVMDGCACIQAIRAMGHLNHTQIFLMSAEWPAQRQADQLGVGFIRKPFDLADLMKRLRGPPPDCSQVAA